MDLQCLFTSSTFISSSKTREAPWIWVHLKVLLRREVFKWSEAHNDQKLII
jgi:hypothetical protein